MPKPNTESLFPISILPPDTPFKFDMPATGEFFSCGTIRNTEILRYKHFDGSISGILFKVAGGIFTARHVAKANDISGFKSIPAENIDIAYKTDGTCTGLPLGFTEKLLLDDVEMVTTTIDNPNELVVIPGRIGFHLSPTLAQPFYPNDAKNAAKYFLPGGSGSPLIYKDHLIGLIPWRNLDQPYQAEAIVFNNQDIVKIMTEPFGLSLERTG